MLFVHAVEHAFGSFYKPAETGSLDRRRIGRKGFGTAVHDNLAFARRRDHGDQNRRRAILERTGARCDRVHVVVDVGAWPDFVQSRDFMRAVERWRRAAADNIDIDMFPAEVVENAAHQLAHLANLLGSSVTGFPDVSWIEINPLETQVRKPQKALHQVDQFRPGRHTYAAESSLHLRQNTHLDLRLPRRFR